MGFNIAKYVHKVVVGSALFDNLIMCIFVCSANCKFLFTVYQNTSYDHEQQPGALKNGVILCCKDFIRFSPSKKAETDKFSIIYLAQINVFNNYRRIL